jgi:U4/U6 small nuclear ribonucleoprotein PRP31
VTYHKQKDNTRRDPQFDDNFLQKMSTLADELLQDFEGSGSEAGGDEHDDGLFGEAGLSTGTLGNGDTAMEEVQDGEDEEDDDANAMEGLDGTAASSTDDAADAKAKIEKMQLGSVRDVRIVAGLMKTLTPVLEVSLPSPF